MTVDSVDLTPAQRRHLRELVGLPYWWPRNGPERRCAEAMARKALVVFNPSRGAPQFELTRRGREAFVALAVVKHPAPWRVESDWTEEVIDADGRCVAKCRTRENAERLVALANGGDAR